MRKFLPYLLVLLALGGGTAYVLYRYSPSTLKAAESNFKVESVADITRILLTNSEGQRIELTQQAGVWLVNKQYEPNEEAIGQLLTAITKLEPMYPVPNAAQKNVLQEMQQHCNHIEIFTNDATKPSAV